MKLMLNVACLVIVTITSLNAEGARKSKTGSYSISLAGSSTNDNLVGSVSSDVIAGFGGNDWLDGRSGNDVLIGGNGADTFVLRGDGGDDIIADFVLTDSLATTDRIMFDTGGVYDGWLGPFGMTYYDGLVFQNSKGTATFLVTAVDVNGDGVIDTRIQANNDSITLLSISPSQLKAYHIQGG